VISRRHRQLERRLRDERPEAPDGLVRSISGRVGVRRSGVPRLALGGAMTAVMLVAVGSVGGISYAANAAKQAAKIVQKAVSPSGAITVTGISSGGDQYRPGYGWGDDNHTHTGPPGLQRPGGEAAPPLRSRPVANGKAKLVSFSVAIDEQAALRIHVLDASGKTLLLTQQGSRIGNGISGPQTKTIRYTVLVPRSIPITLRIPANLLKAGQTYTVRVVAIDPDGARSEIRIPFVG
jgi:hypothetical protein